MKLVGAIRSMLSGRKYRAALLAATTIPSFAAVGVASSASGASTSYQAAVLANNPVLYYRLDDASGSPATDSSTAGNNGTYSASGITYSVPGALTDSADQPDAAVTADGSASVPVTSTGPVGITGDQPWTMEAWYRSSSSNPQMVVTFGTAATNQSVGMAVDPATGGQSGYRLVAELYNSWVEWDGLNLNDGRWHQLAISYGGVGGTTPRFQGYVDGQSLASPTNGQPARPALYNNVSLPLNVASGPAQIGGWFNTGYYKPLNGSVDEVAVYPSALSSSDLLAHYNASFDSSSPHVGPASHMSISLGTPTVTADGTSQVIAKVQVTDNNQPAQPVAGDNVTLVSSDPKETVAPDTTNTYPAGTYGFVVTSSTTAGPVTLTATDATPSAAVVTTSTLTQTPGSGDTVALTLQPPTLPADGKSQTTAIIRVTDHGNPVAGAQPKLATDGGQTLDTTSFKDNGDGTYTEALTASTAAGTSNLTATLGAATASAVLSQYALPVDVAGATSWPPAGITCSDTWAAAGNGNWSTASNWSNGLVPGAGDVVCLPPVPSGQTGARSYVVDFTGSATVANLVVGAPAASALDGTGAATTQTLQPDAGGSYPAVLTVTQGGVVGPSGELNLTASNYYNTYSEIAIPAGAVLTNTGTVQVSPDNGAGRAISGSVSNTGTMNINAGVSFNSAGAVLDNRGTVTLNANMDFPTLGGGAKGTTFVADQGGSVVDTAGGTVTMEDGNRWVQGAGSVTGPNPPTLWGGNGEAVNLSLTGSGQASLNLHDLTDVTGNVAPGDALTVIADGSRSATLAATGSFTNHGTIELTASNYYNTTSLLRVPSGSTMTNASDGQLIVDPTNNAGRSIQGNVTNQGTVNINAPTSFNQAGSTFDNRGQLNVAAWFDFPGNSSGSESASTFNSDTGGTITTTGGNYIELDQGNNWIQGGGTMAAGDSPAHVGGGYGVPSNVSIVGSGPVNLNLYDLTTLTGDVSRNQTLNVLAEQSDPGRLRSLPTPTNPTGSFTNAGTIHLTADNYYDTTSQVAVPTGGTITNTGTIYSDPTNGAGRNITASVVNQGVVRIAANTSFDQPGATFDNQNTLLVAAHFDFPANGGGPSGTRTFKSTGGSTAISSTGSLTLEAGDQWVQGMGALASGSPHPLISGGSGVYSTINFTGSGPVTLDTVDFVAVTGKTVPGQTVDVWAQSSQWASLVAFAGFANGGTIDLTSNNNYNTASQLQISPGTTVDNTGTLQTDAAAGGGRNLNGNFVNHGTVTVNGGLSFNGPGTTFDNQGQLNLGSNFSFTANGSGAAMAKVFNSDTGGTIAGTGILSVSYGDEWLQGQGQLLAGVPSPQLSGGNGIPVTLQLAGPGTADLNLYDKVTLTGPSADSTIAPHQVLRLWAQGSDPVVVSAAGNVTNDGRIILTANNNYNTSANFNVPSGSTLTNNSDGTIESDPSNGGGRSVNAAVDQLGTVLIEPGTGLGLSQAPTNVGGADLPGTWNLGGDVSWPGASTITNLTGNLFLGGGTIRDATNNADAVAKLATVAPGANLTLLPGSTKTLAGALTNNGAVNLQSSLAGGVSSLSTQGFTQTSGGLLSVGVGYEGNSGITTGTSGSAPAGTATLAGTLNVASDQSFNPQSGSRFQIIQTAQTPSGTFQTINGVDQPGDPNYAASYETTGFYLTVSQPTTTSVTSSTASGAQANTYSSTFGDPVTFTASVVSGNQPVNSGVVTFTDASGAAGSNPTLAACTGPNPVTASSGTATCTIAANPGLPAGTHQLTATFSDSTRQLQSSAAMLTQTVAAVATTTTLAPPTQSGQAPFGSDLPLSATVTAASGGGLLDGAVSFLESQDGGKTWVPIADCTPTVPTPGAGSPSTGTAQCAEKSLNVGTYQVEATYNADKADPNTAPSTSAAAPLQVTGQQAVVTITTSADPAAAGQPVTFTATASVNNAPPPGGSFSFFSTPAGATAQNPVVGCQNVPVDANGKATCQTPSLPVGTEIVDAVFTSDPNAPNYLSGTNGVTEHVGPTATALTASADPSTARANVTFTAQVTSPVDAAAGAPFPGGTVTFTSVPVAGGATTTLCGGPVTTANAQATCTTAFATPGTYTVTASYSGDAGNAPSVATWTQTVGALPTTTTVASATQPSSVGAAATFTATVLDTHGNPVTAGQLAFTTVPNTGVTSTSCAPVTFGAASAGQGSCTLTFTQAGTYTVTASYTDATGVLAPSNGSVGQGVGVPATTTSVTVADNTQPAAATGTANTGDSLTFTAMVTQPGSTAVPTGTVDFKATDQNANTTVLCSAVTMASGSAACNATAPTASAYAITASYSGDAADAPSLGWEAMTVNPAGTQSQASTTTSVTATPNPSGVGAPVTVTASITGAAPTGTLTFVETPVGGNPAVIASCPTALPSGKTSASCQYTPKSSGTYTFSASYGGDANNAPSSGAVGHTVSGDATTTSVTSAAPSASPGSPVAFTAAVAWAGQAVTSGTVSFAVTPATGTTVPASCAGAAVSATGTATCSVTFATAGTYTVTATYNDPTGTYAASAGSVGQTIGQPATATAITSANPTSSPGAAVTFTATVTSGSNPVTTGAVTFAVAPAGATVPASCTGEVVSATGTATCSITFPTAGTYTVTASYADASGTYGSSSSSVAQGVGETPTATAISSATPSSAPGTPVTFTATVTSGSNPVTTGAVTFTVAPAGATVPASCTGEAVSATGTATCSITFPTAGTYTVTASYADASGTYATSTSSVGQGVGETATATKLTSSNPSSTSGSAVTFTATVTSGTNPVTTGAVTFAVTPATGVTTPATCSNEALSATGTASCSITFAGAGTYTVTASYADSSNTNAPSSDSVGQGVGANQSKVGLTYSPAGNPTVGQQVTFTVTVNGTAGSVDFVDQAVGQSSVTICQGVALSNGQAQCTTSGLPAGSNAVTAYYSGDSSHAPSTATVPLTVTTASAYAGACTGVTLTVAQASVIQGGSDTFTAAATGCSPAQYAFLQYSSGSWQIVQNWSQTSTYNVPTNLAPSAQPYYYAVWVKAASAPTSDTFYDTYAVQTVTVNAAPTCTAVLSPSANEVTEPSPATVSVGSLGAGCSSPQYWFRMWSPSSGWVTAQDWSTNASYTLNTTNLTPAVYYFYAQVRNGANGIPSYVYAANGGDATVAVDPPAACTAAPGIALSGNGVQRPGGGTYLAQVGGSVTVSATAPSGCSGPLQYAYELYRPGGNGVAPAWFFYDPVHNTFTNELTTGSAPVYTSTTSFSWSTASELASTYNYEWQVQVQYDNWAQETQINLVSSAPCTGSPTLTPVDNGNGTITVTATGVTGCPTPQYYFWTTNATYGSTPPANHDGAWVAAYPSQPDTSWTYGAPSTYSSNNSFTYTKPSGTTAPYTFDVWVREAGSSSGYQVSAESPGVS